MKQLRLTLIVSCLLIGLGIFIMLQSDFVKSAYKPEVVVHSFKEDWQTPTNAHTPAIPEGQANTVQTDVIAADNVEITTIITRETGSVFKNDQWQAGLTGEVPAETRPEGAESMGTGSGGNTFFNQSSKKNETAQITMNILPVVNHAAGESIEDVPEPPITFEPVRLTAPLVEVEASNWLEYGNENGEREDPVPFIWPAEKHWLSGYNFSIYHPGIDIAAIRDDLIFAAASGKVVVVHHSNHGYGNMVIINHLNGYQTLYAHLNTILTEMGNFVIQGQPIGLAGSTGNSTGAHLHFEVHYQGRFVNPWLFLTQ
jgi:murein DD-endopeptidase MepM/ murein hydrolase activator NlpD